MSDLREQKTEMRRAMAARRRDAAREHPDAAFALRDLFLKHIELPKGSIISYYVAREAEMDPAPLAAALHAMDHPLCLPATIRRGEPLSFRAYAPGDALAPQGPMGILEPSATARTVEPDTLLVPLLAFDRARRRLGYGGGYYDRTLTNLRGHRKILAIGIAYACQEATAVPAGASDAVLDKVVTELQVFAS